MVEETDLIEHWTSELRVALDEARRLAEQAVFHRNEFDRASEEHRRQQEDTRTHVANSGNKALEEYLARVNVHDDHTLTRWQSHGTGDKGKKSFDIMEVSTWFEDEYS